jgi:cyclic 2,3-diphosphoglycerate synthetase
VRTIVLVDGEHYPPVVRAAIDSLPGRIPGCEVVGAVLLGGTEKLADDVNPAVEFGVPVLVGRSPEEAILAALQHYEPELVVDLSDQPVVDGRIRLRLAARVLVAGAAYQGSDFRFDPPPRPRLTDKPTLAVIGTGKRTGKTAVASQVARLLAARGTPPVIVAMGRGGPAEPELVDPTTFDLTARGLVTLAASGRHAASDHLEDALTARVTTVGTRRCGGGMAGAPVDDTFAAGVALAAARPESLLLYEGSGQAVPPAHADATVLVTPATADPELVIGYLGAYRVLLADLVVITMCETSLAVSGAEISSGISSIEQGVRGLAPGARVVTTVFRPTPLEPISGRPTFYATTAPDSVLDLLTEHLEQEHGCSIVGTSTHLADRRRLAADLEGAGEAEVLLVELKAAAVDLAARVALERGMEVVFCDNTVMSTGGDGQFDDLAFATADLAHQRQAEGRHQHQA